MATLELFQFQRFDHREADGRHLWSVSMSINDVPEPKRQLPYIRLASGLPWTEANTWLASRACDPADDLSAKTIIRDARSLVSYANFLEANGLVWNDLHKPDSEKPTYLYKSHRSLNVKEGTGAYSTAQTELRAVAKFYIWCTSTGQLSDGCKPFLARTTQVQVSTKFGSKTVEKTVSNMPLKRRRTAPRSTLEGGLKPVPAELQKRILTLSEAHAGTEVTLMLAIGFSSGIRLGSITDLKCETIEKAASTNLKGHKSIKIGPAHGVMTKFSTNYSPVVPDALIQRLTSYITSVRRLKRAIKHGGRYSQYLFLTPQGRPYHDDDGIPSSAIGVAIHRIRAIAQASDLPIEDFRFHDSRATFACNLLDAAMAIGIPVTSALSTITEFLGQSDERTALRYVQHAQKRRIVGKYNDLYGQWLLELTQHETP